MDKHPPHIWCGKKNNKDHNDKCEECCQMYRYFPWDYVKDKNGEKAEKFYFPNGRPKKE